MPGFCHSCWSPSAPRGWTVNAPTSVQALKIDLRLHRESYLRRSSSSAQRWLQIDAVVLHKGTASSSTRSRSKSSRPRSVTTCTRRPRSSSNSATSPPGNQGSDRAPPPRGGRHHSVARHRHAPSSRTRARRSRRADEPAGESAPVSSLRGLPSDVAPSNLSVPSSSSCRNRLRRVRHYRESCHITDNRRFQVHFRFHRLSGIACFDQTRPL